MKLYLLIFSLMASFSVAANPWDKLEAEITNQLTLTDLINAKTKFYSRQERTPLTRSLDFGYLHTLWEFDLVHGNYSTDFKLSLITRNDSIIFGRLERMHWKGNTQKTTRFSVNEAQLRKLVTNHNDFYSTSYSLNGFMSELMHTYYFSLGCGETGINYPKEAEQMLKWAESNEVNRLNKWLLSPNFELQAYAIEGLTIIKEMGKPMPKQVDNVINQLRIRNSTIINCAGCLMGLWTPLNQLLFEYRKK